jgi:hypothetical protein
MLLRVIVDPGPPTLVLTAMKTSRISRYLREEEPR